MDELIKFLRNQIDEDEQIAVAATRDAGGAEWSAGSELLSESVTLAETGSSIVSGPYGGLSWELRRYIADQDPDRLLREVKAKRDLLMEHEDNGVGSCGTCVDWMNDHLKWPCRTVQILALPFSDRPGYREEWKV